jgi:hypothetical protein
MKYTVEKGSGAMLFMSRIIRTGSAIQHLIGRGDTQTETAW